MVLDGAGSSFAYPLLSKWASAYAEAGGDRVNYQSVGSGRGIELFRDKITEFAVVEKPLDAAELAQLGAVQFPVFLGTVAVAVNLKGYSNGMVRLSGDLLAKIFLGKINWWNAAEIAAANPGLPLPEARIQPFVRSDMSGTTYVSTRYLSEVSPDFAAAVGSGLQVQGMSGAKAKGNEGVAQYVRQAPGAIGFLSWPYAVKNALATARLVNRSGTAVLAGRDTLAAAAETAVWDGDQAPGVLVNAEGKDSWPIATASYVVCAPGSAAGAFFDFAFREGDGAAASLDYQALPASAKEAAHKTWRVNRN